MVVRRPDARRSRRLSLEALEDRTVPAAFLVGRSVHSVEEAVSAEGEGADYVVFGTVFPSGSKPRGHRTAGQDALSAVSQAVNLG